MKIIYNRKAEPLGDIRRSSCRGGDVGRLCSLVVRAVDRQSKDLGSNPNAVESVFFLIEKFSNSLIFKFICIYLRYKSLKLSTRTPVDNVSYLIRE